MNPFDIKNTILVINGENKGPYSDQEIINLLCTGQIDRNCVAWQHNATTPCPVGQMPAFANVALATSCPKPTAQAVPCAAGMPGVVTFSNAFSPIATPTANPIDAQRADFLTKTYLHLGGAVLAFAFIESILLDIPGLSYRIMSLLTVSKYSWLLVLAAYMAVSHIAEKWARSATSLETQYAGLGLYVIAEAIIFLPLLMTASRMNHNIIPTAGILTFLIFGGMSAVVFVTRKNFSFLGPVLSVISFAALGLIVCSIIFGFSLGVLFTVVMIAVASAYILFYTSNVLNEYKPTQYVAASLALFSAVALLFWYVVRLLMISERE